MPAYIMGTPIISDSDYFRIYFQSGDDNLGTGFRATYTFIDPPAGEFAPAVTLVITKKKG